MIFAAIFSLIVILGLGGSLAIQGSGSLNRKNWRNL